MEKLLPVKNLLKMMLWTILIILAAVVLVLGVPSLVTELYARPRLYTVETVPDAKVAIVFGAGLQRDGSPTPILRARVATAADLYFSGKVQKLLMSGDNRYVNYNEPKSMHDYAISLGVPEKDIVMDYAGRRTYDTCYRAKQIFGVDHAILVTQKFHQPRALYTCNLLGVQSTGVASDRGLWIRKIWRVREVPATLMALVDVWVRHPLPVLGEQEPIFPIGKTGG